MKKHVGIVATSQVTGLYMQEQIEKFLGEYVTTLLWPTSVSKMSPEQLAQSDIIIFSNKILREEVAQYLPSGKKVIVAERTLNIKNIYKILDLYKGQKVLIIATTKETGLNTINVLKKFGINYIDPDIYWPGCGIDPQKYDTALTTGLGYLVPHEIKNVIELGGKGIDISTFALILEELELPYSLLDNISNFYFKDIVRNIIKLNTESKRNYTIRKSMTAILNGIGEGILAFNNKKRIIFINKAAQNIFNFNENEALIKKVDDILPGENDMLYNINEKPEKIITINGNSYVLNAFELAGGVIESAEGIITLMPVDTVREMDIRVRRELRKKGNVAYYRFSDIIGQSSALLSAIELSKKFATTNLNILIEGESGVGKEVFAQSIHNASSLRNAPFVAANFAAIPESLVESELFGYEEGAFTGAKKGGKRGLFEEAHMGTIFLDEIDSASKDAQNKLLRVIEEQEVRRVGGNAIVPINVRVIAATNVALYEQVKKGDFRLDLFYRLCAVPINIPPLYARENDILLMIKHFSKLNYGYELEMSLELEQFTKSYSWPGNVRELNNFVHYLCNIKLAGRQADIGDLPKYMRENSLLNDERLTPPKSCAVLGCFEKHLTDVDFKADVVNLLEELENCCQLNIKAGRYRLFDSLKQKCSGLTEYKLKYYLKLLAKHKLVKIGQTKQGTEITNEGRDFLRALID